jgi:predicted polyphosphate/ATP-dependent NAD kinase
MMPDMDMIGKAATNDISNSLKIRHLEMPVFNNESDSTKASKLMREIGVGCLITLGGDGTNRAVVKELGDIPLIPISTGTNNVFPKMIEGTVAGLAAGVVASESLDINKISSRVNLIEVYLNNKLADIALVDVAVSKETFVGSRAIWDMNSVHEIFLGRSTPASIGLSSIGSQLCPSLPGDKSGTHLIIGKGGKSVIAPIAPGIIRSVEILDSFRMAVGEKINIELRPCTIALDGERAFSLSDNQTAHVSINDTGPVIVSVEETLRQASIAGIFRDN